MANTTVKNEYYDLVLDSADRLFGHYGYKKTTVEDIANDIGISRATLYLYFSGKEEIALSWIDRKSEGLLQELTEIALRQIPVAELIREMLIARVMNVFDRACKFTNSIDELLAALRPTLFLRRELHHKQQADLFQYIIERGQSAKTFQPGNSENLARMLIIASNSLMPYNLSAKQLGQRDSINNEINQLADFLLKGLCTRQFGLGIEPQTEVGSD